MSGLIDRERMANIRDAMLLGLLTVGTPIALAEVCFLLGRFAYSRGWLPVP